MISDVLEKPSTLGGILKQYRGSICTECWETLAELQRRGIVHANEHISALLKQSGRVIVITDETIGFIPYVNICNFLLRIEGVRGDEIFFNLYNDKIKGDA